MASLLLFNKPYGVLSQFTTKEDKPTLADYIKVARVYPAGRLDHDSEGLLLLTDDGDLQHHISHPAHKQPKTYWVQVEGAPNSYALTQLRQGIALNDGITQPAEVRLIPAPKLWERDPPIRSRVNLPTQWMEITITEGKNRQVRRMTAAVGHPTLRLVRVKIGPWTLEGIEPGTFKVEQVNAPKAPASARPRTAQGRPNNARPSSKTNEQRRTSNTTHGNKDQDARGNRDRSTAGKSSSGIKTGYPNKTASSNRPSTRQRDTNGTATTKPRSNSQPGSTPTKTVIIQKPRSKLSLNKPEE